MFRSIWREVRSTPGHILALLLAAPAFVFVDAGHVLRHPFALSLSHVAYVVLAICCLVALFAEGAAPRQLHSAGPWQRPHGERRRDALRVTVCVLVALILCGEAIDLLEPLQPAMHVETWDDGKSTLSYPEITGIGDAIAFALKVALSLAGLVLTILGLCAPACAALHGWRRCGQEAWRAWRGHYFSLFALTFLGMLALIPAGFLIAPLVDYWRAIGSGAVTAGSLRAAFDICNLFGPARIIYGAAAATLLLGIVLWSYSRAIARLIERPRG
ncbi:MAG TPA: hypothetical protein PLR41_17685 [Alphaproteobacteria bacterium]|nr:hypothetical protein [Alphaproteobacteria bacterium]